MKAVDYEFMECRTGNCGICPGTWEPGTRRNTCTCECHKTEED